MSKSRIPSVALIKQQVKKYTLVEKNLLAQNTVVLA